MFRFTYLICFYEIDYRQLCIYTRRINQSIKQSINQLEIKKVAEIKFQPLFEFCYLFYSLKIIVPILGG